MPSLNMQGPYELTEEKIDEVVTKKSPGNYALGKTNDKKVFIVKYVGRSDDDVNGRLKEHVGEYDQFKFKYAGTAKAAFEEECRNWHDFGGPEEKLDNKVHPDRPDGKTYPCPICNVFDDN